ncbi:MAG TPA: hypothetical protein VGK88_14090 [bacterium]|jgi:hypothetical protein
MSVRAVARVAPHRRWAKYPQPDAQVIAWPSRRARTWWARFADDRELAGLKLIIVGILVLAVMMLEVPW